VIEGVLVLELGEKIGSSNWDVQISTSTSTHLVYPFAFGRIINRHRGEGHTDWSSAKRQVVSRPVAAPPETRKW
jgi:hypothetical protein